MRIFNKIHQGITIFLFIQIYAVNIYAQNNYFFKTYEVGYGASVTSLKNDGYLIMGALHYNTPYIPQSLYFLRLDEQGKKIWSRTYDTLGSLISGHDIKKQDDFYYMTGTFYKGSEGGGPSDILLALFNSEGDTIKWFRYHLNNSFWNKGNSGIVTDSSGYIIAGSIDDNGLIMKSKDREILWNKEYSFGTGGGATEFLSVLKDETGNFFILGKYAKLFPASIPTYKYFVLKTDENGDSLWIRDYGEEARDLYFTKFLQTNDNNFLLMGYIQNPTKEYAFVVKLSQIGNIIWEEKYKFICKDIAETRDGSFVMLGKSAAGNRIDLLKINNWGDTLFTNKILLDSVTFEPEAVDITDEENLIITGQSLKFNDDGRIFLMKTDSHGNLVGVNEKNNDLLRSFILNQNYPNPFNSETKIRFILSENKFVTLIVYDLLGREVAKLVDEEKSTGSHEYLFNALELTSGIYFYNLKAGGFSETKKLVLLK